MIEYSNYFDSNDEIENYSSRTIQNLANNIEYIEAEYTHNNNTILLEEEPEHHYPLSTVKNAFASNKNHSSMNNSSNENYYDLVIFTHTRDSDLKSIRPKRAIFSIKKEKKCGRRKSYLSHMKKAKHNEFSVDNLVQKIKKNFNNSLTKYINQKYQVFYNQKNKGKNIAIKLLQKTSPEFARACSKKVNQKFLKLKVGEIFSINVSKKCTRFNEDHNKKQIELLYKKNEAKEVIEIMNNTVEEIYEKYISNEIKEFSLEHDLIELEKKFGIEYKNNYQGTANKLISILHRKGKVKKRKFISKKVNINVKK